MGGVPSFGFFIDDVYHNEYDANLIDIERIELLRGPQGTLYGRNTIGGVLNIITKKPDNTWNAKIGAGYGNFNTREISGTLSGPLVKDKFFVRFSGHHDRSDGYMENRFDGDDKANQPENTDARLSFRYTPDPALILDFGIDALRYESRYTDFVALSQIRSDSDPHTANVDYKGDALKEAYTSHLRVEYDTGNKKIISISSLYEDDNRLDPDMDFTPADGQRQFYQRNYSTFSQELRLVSDDQKSPLEWIVGLYGFKEDQDNRLVYTLGQDWADPSMGFFPGDFPIIGENETFGAAIFGELSYRFKNDIKVTGGLRYDRETQDFTYDAVDAGGAQGSTDETFEAVLPKISLNYLGNPNYMPYASVTRGYKSGGFNLQNSQGEVFDPEYTWNYEAGVKMQWFKNTLSLNAAVYYIDWTDLQVNASNGVDFLTTNAGAATSKGIELEMAARPADGLKVYGAISYTHSKFDDYRVRATDGSNGIPPRPAMDFSNNYVPAVPDYTARLGVSYRTLFGLFAGVDYIYTGRVFMNNENTLAEGDYNLFNAKLGYEKERFEIYLWAKNLFDETYATSYVDFRETGAGLWGRPGAPRTFGLSVGYRF